MPKRKLHLDGPQPRGVTQGPHARRTKKSSKSAKPALATVREDADEAAAELCQILDSNAAAASGTPVTMPGACLPLGALNSSLLDLLQPVASNAVVVLPNACVSITPPTPSDAASRSAPEPIAGAASTRLPEVTAYARSLMKINVSAAAVLAEKRLPLEQVIHIAPGTVLKFGKPCEQPLDLEVGGRRIAVGEAITIGERFGLRITALRK